MDPIIVASRNYDGEANSTSSNHTQNFLAPSSPSQSNSQDQSSFLERKSSLIDSNKANKAAYFSFPQQTHQNQALLQQQQFKGHTPPSPTKEQSIQNQRKRKRWNETQKYKCCGRFIITMNKKRWLLLGLMVLISLILVSGLGVLIPFIMGSKSNVPVIVNSNGNDNNPIGGPERIYVGDTTGTLIEFSISASEPVQSVKAFQDGYICFDNCIIIDRNSSKIYTGSTSGSVTVWPLGQKFPSSALSTIRRPLSNTPDEFFSMHLGPQGQLWVGTAKTEIIEFGSQTGTVRNIYLDPTVINGTYSMKFSPRTGTLFGASLNNGISLWNTATRTRIANYSLANLIQTPAQGATALALINNETRLLAGMYDRSSVAIWDISNQSIRFNRSFPADFTIWVISHDPQTNRAFIGGSETGEIAVLDLSSGTFLSNMPGHTDIVTTLIINDRFLFSCGYDNRVIQWNLDTRRIIKEWNMRSANSNSNGCRSMAVY